MDDINNLLKVADIKYKYALKYPPLVVKASRDELEFLCELNDIKSHIIKRRNYNGWFTWSDWIPAHTKHKYDYVCECADVDENDPTKGGLYIPVIICRTKSEFILKIKERIRENSSKV